MCSPDCALDSVQFSLVSKTEPPRVPSAGKQHPSPCPTPPSLSKERSSGPASIPTGVCPSLQGQHHSRKQEENRVPTQVLCAEAESRTSGHFLWATLLPVSADLFLSPRLSASGRI